MPAKVKSPQTEDAIRDYQSGEGLSDLARTYHTSVPTLKAELVARGLLRTPEQEAAWRSERGRQRWLKKDTLPVPDIATRYGNGESENAIAVSLGVSRAVIRKRLIRSGVPIRDSASANRLMMQSRSAEENASNVAAAHEAVRGRKVGFDELCKRAAGRERVQSHASALERQFAEWLAAAGLQPILQKAVGPYNLDIALFPVAVEIFGGAWHATGRHATRAHKRFEYILDHGWSVVVIWVDLRAGGLTIEAADYVIAHAKRVGSTPPLRGQYGVIRGDGQEVAPSGVDLNNLTVVPSRKRRLD